MRSIDTDLCGMAGATDAQGPAITRRNLEPAGSLALLRALALAIIPFLTTPSAALAQTQSTQPQSTQPQPANQVQLDDRPMRVTIVRLDLPGCEPNCPEWIAASGRIDATTPAAFRRAFARLGKRKLPVLIDSRGGSVDHALAVGRMIRARGLDVAVTKTTLAPCEATDTRCRKLQAGGTLLGRPEARITICASSCAFILAGGVKRYVGPWTIVGLHEIKSTATMRRFQRLYRVEHRYSWGNPVEVRRTLIREKTLSTQTVELATGEQTYDKIRQFFAQMGVSEAIMPILRSAPNSSIRWVRPSELRTTALATDFVNGEQLLAVAPPVAQPAAPVAAITPAAPVPSHTTASPTPLAMQPAPLAALPSQAAPSAPAPVEAPVVAPPPVATQTNAVPAASTAARRADQRSTAPSAKPAAPAKTAAQPKPQPTASAAPRSQEERRLPLGFQ